MGLEKRKRVIDRERESERTCIRMSITKRAKDRDRTRERE